MKPVWSFLKGATLCWADIWFSTEMFRELDLFCNKLLLIFEIGWVIFFSFTLLTCIGFNLQILCKPLVKITNLKTIRPETYLNFDLFWRRRNLLSALKESLSSLVLTLQIILLRSLFNSSFWNNFSIGLLTLGFQSASSAFFKLSGNAFTLFDIIGVRLIFLLLFIFVGVWDCL